MATSTTIDFTPKGSLDSQGAALTEGIRKFELVIDTNASNTNGVNLTTAGGEYALFDIPEGHLHLSTVVEVLTAEGGTATADIGVGGGDLDAFIDGVNLNGTAGTITWSGAATTAEVHSSGGATAGYTTPDGGIAVVLDPQNDLDAAKFRVTMLWVDMRGGGTTGFANQA